MADELTADEIKFLRDRVRQLEIELHEVRETLGRERAARIALDEAFMISQRELAEVRKDINPA
jgi:hypothetical protein